MTDRMLFVRLLKDGVREPGRLAVVFMAVSLLGASQLYLTWLIKRWVEGPLASGDRGALVSLMAVGAVVMIVGAACLFVSRYLMTGMNQRLVERLRAQAVDRLLSLEVSAIRRHPTGDVLARVLHDASRLSVFLSQIVRRTAREVIVGVGALTMLFVLNWRLALASALLLPITGILLVRLGAAIRRWDARAQSAVGGLGAMLNEQLHGVTTIKGFQTERVERNRFAGQSAEVRRNVMRAERWSGALLAVVFLSTGFGLLAIVWYGTVQLGSGSMTRGDLLAFALYAGQVVEPLRRISEIHRTYQGILATASRVYRIIDQPSVERRAGLVLPAPVDGTVSFDRVTFAYGDAAPVLRDVSLSVRAGEHVAIVGASGEGKSTIAALLVRFLEPQAGSIRLDGQDIGQTRLSDLRRAIVVVEQETFLFSGRLIDNLRYGSEGVSTAEIREASRMAGLTALVARLPEGFDSRLTEGGRQLSIGERQRVALARAIVRRPPVLVLDEATSAVDGETEGEIFDALAPWMTQRTVLATGHRFSTISRFSRIIVLKHGRVVGDGPLDVLLRTCPAFVDLFTEQIASATEANGQATGGRSSSFLP